MFRKIIELKKLFLLGSLFIFNPSPLISDEFPEKKLLSDAIKLYSSISPEDSLKEKIYKKEVFLKKIDEIIDKYSETEIGLELLIKKSYENFDIVKIRKDYLNSLIKYNLSICELDPSYKCLAFVSLDQANKFCNSNNKLPQLVLAAKSLNNSYDIFNNQKDSKVFIPAVFSSFRQCVDSAPDQFSKDFIKSYFIQTLLKNNQDSKAIGITEGMKTDMFRIHSAAEIRDYQGKFDIETFLTLIKRAAKLPDEDREISSLFLSNKLFKNNAQPFDEKVFKYMPKEFKSKSIACGDMHTYYSEIGLDFIFSSNKYANLRGERQENRNLIINDLNVGINKCNTFNTIPINYFIEKNNFDIATKIREFQSKNGLNPKDGIVFFDRILTNKQITDYFINQNQIFEDYLLENRGLPLSKLKKIEKNLMYPYIELAGDYAIFKSFVDMNDTCNASSILFQRLKNTNYEAPAVSYYISNPLLSEDKNYRCGDAELQLLIN